MKLTEIKTKKTFSYAGKVYDLEIEDDHTYNVHGIFVHNSDYVMVGSMFNKALESAGETTREDGQIIGQFSERAKIVFGSDIPLYKTFRGMSTKEVQKDWGVDDLKTSEGIVRRNRVEYTLEGWVQNFESYLRSAMSYTGKKELSQFIGRVQTNFISQNSFKRIDK